MSQDISNDTDITVQTVKITDDHLRVDSEFVRQGDIYRGDVCVCPGLSVSKEVRTLEEFDSVYNALPQTEGVLRVRPYLEGSMLRVYHVPELGWRVSTNRSADAQRARWGSSLTFQGHLDDVVQTLYGMTLAQFYELLDPNVHYYFLMTSAKCLYATPVSKRSLLLAFARDILGVHLNPTDVAAKCTAIKIHCVKSHEYLNLRTEFKHENCIGMVAEHIPVGTKDTERRYCFFHPSYATRLDAYNELFTGVKFVGERLLSLSETELNAVCEKMPHLREHVKALADAKRTFCKQSHALYVRRYIQKKFEECAPPMHHFVKRLFKRYTDSETKTPTYQKDVVAFFNTLDASDQFSYLRKFVSPQIGGQP